MGEQGGEEGQVEAPRTEPYVADGQQHNGVCAWHEQGLLGGTGDADSDDPKGGRCAEQDQQVVLQAATFGHWTEDDLD